MSISLNANFELLSAGLYLDARQQFNTIIEMRDFAETSIPDGFVTYNKETQNHYVFNSSNTVDAIFGKWREYNRGGGSSEKQIKDWVSGSSYLEGDYIYHEGELYRCLASNRDVDFDESNWEQVTYDIDELSKEDVEGLLGLTKEEIEAMADLILDTEVRIDKTYSSSKIYTDIQQCLEDSKTYTLEEIARVSTASYKVVTDVVDMTEEKYLYLLYDGTTNYDIYIVETDGTPTKIGNTQIDLSNYYTKTEIDSEVVKKTDITTTIDNSSTDTQIPSAKAMYDKLTTEIGAKANTSDIPTKVSELTNDSNYQTANQVNSVVTTEIAKVETELKGSIEEINDSLVDIESALDELENITRLTDFDEAIPEKGKNKIYYVNKLLDPYICAQWRVESMYYDVSGIKQYRGVQIATSINGVDNIMLMREYYLDDNNVVRWGDWKELATMDKLNYSTVPDVSKTLTPLFPNGVKVASGGVTISYIVRNGWCNVNFKFNITSSTTFSWTDIAWGLPIPANSIDTVLMSDGKATQPIPIKITSTGSVSSKVISSISTTDWWTGNITYPVAE